LAGVMPEQTWPIHLAAYAWIAAFAGFAVVYWPILTRPKTERRRPRAAP
jgi:uncharacterized protein involved in response to NO